MPAANTSEKCSSWLPARMPPVMTEVSPGTSGKNASMATMAKIAG
jgi:hypothetical protein